MFYLTSQWIEREEFYIKFSHEKVFFFCECGLYKQKKTGNYQSGSWIYNRWNVEWESTLRYFSAPP